jgi:transcriptional regulator with XRE-family HTH domain
MPSDAYKRFVARAEKSAAYWQQIVLSEFLESLFAQMSRKNMRPSDVADALGKSAGYVSRVLNGEENPTIANLIRFSRAVDGVLHVHVADRNAVTEWDDKDFSTGAIVHDVTFGSAETGSRSTRGVVGRVLDSPAETLTDAQ